MTDKCYMLSQESSKNKKSQIKPMDALYEIWFFAQLHDSQHEVPWRDMHNNNSTMNDSCGVSVMVVTNVQSADITSQNHVTTSW